MEPSNPHSISTMKPSLFFFFSFLLLLTFLCSFSSASVEEACKEIIGIETHLQQTRVDLLTAVPLSETGNMSALAITTANRIHTNTMNLKPKLHDLREAASGLTKEAYDVCMTAYYDDSYTGLAEMAKIISRELQKKSLDAALRAAEGAKADVMTCKDAFKMEKCPIAKENEDLLNLCKLCSYYIGKAAQTVRLG